MQKTVCIKAFSELKFCHYSVPIWQVTFIAKLYTPYCTDYRNHTAVMKISVLL